MAKSKTSTPSQHPPSYKLMSSRPRKVRKHHPYNQDCHRLSTLQTCLPWSWSLRKLRMLPQPISFLYFQACHLCIPHETLLGAYELRRDKKARCLQPETAIALAAALSFPLFF
ncbi:uncharacterized protein BT62DRAFT_247171 [Guyanagaster necrorhizus]|uniref:Uncharacterized protein n=1 Tax=Guyanagaster necrorhizus TaxID=856835 RepID=A0A9P8AR46_9AGAR|nr:uncharacterized protein BT62DRAFT_247171 [Guyanagaster necrorhizus MCA 3950]KAG7444516.1 hypothetical protein BT62DRAFT_247171 [Guyanagaster necrorhizus MCA 3950]